MKKRKHKIKLETIQYQLLYVAMDSHYTKMFDHIAMTDLLKSSIPSIKGFLIIASNVHRNFFFP